MTEDKTPAAPPQEPALRLALRGALWTVVALALVSFLPLTGKLGGGPEGQDFLASLPGRLMGMFMLSMFGFLLGFPVAALSAKNATGYGNAFKKGVISVSGVMGFNVLVMLYSAFSFLFFPYKPVLPSEAAFTFWFGFTGAAGFAVFGGLGAMARYAALGVKPPKKQ
ncbi:MAG: hypothetical protein A2X32_04370 [Elusimicrobia bacterium GWC2_64_44]|nr:MAG: hypothetical protein A2X32_04370 [Elusimicrobia bacterium GWC2_64_44]